MNSDLFSSSKKTKPSFYNVPSFSRLSVTSHSRFNLSEFESDINVFIREYKDRIKRQQLREEENNPSPFVSFGDTHGDVSELEWLLDNEKRFYKNTPNKDILKFSYLSELGFINCMTYSLDGEYIIVGHASGIIQLVYKMDKQKAILAEYANDLATYYKNQDLGTFPNIWYPLFYEGTIKSKKQSAWLKTNYKMYLKGTPNEVLYNRWYYTEEGAISALMYAPNGSYIVVGHLSGLIQMRHGTTGVVLCTLRNIQFPPKPIYALTFNPKEERVCYASCMDGNVYRIDIPNIAPPESPAKACIRADPALECLNTQFYGAPGMVSYAAPFISQRSPALSLGITADQTKMAIGYADTSIKVYDMATQEAELTYKVHKLRLQFIPKKLQRMHFGQVVALKCHDQNPTMFASAAWDNTLRIWDIRCPVGCVMTFEGVNICSNSIDLNINGMVAFGLYMYIVQPEALSTCEREHCIAGSWQPTEALTVWDLTARKRLNIVRVQNRRTDIDGEYIYACQYWRSQKFNRKGKYGIIGGSGTNCVEVINLHNRYISCSYPAPGTVLAITSHEEKIAFGGTASVFNIVTFHDPKHEKYEVPDEIDLGNAIMTFYDEDDDEVMNNDIDLNIEAKSDKSDN